MTRAGRFYELLPAIYRIKDAEQGEPLKALLAVIAEQVNLLDDHIGQTYDNWFIETCEEWLVPYIGDLLGVRPLHPVPSAGVSLRAYVANTLAYRRRKGTASVLEQLARDTTGWSARAVEFFQLLASTEHVNHVRLEAPGWVSLKDANRLELVSGPFEQAPYSAEVRRIATGRGKYNIPNVGLFLWRVQAYPLVRSTPRPVPNPPDGRYTFSPLGLDTPLFNSPQTEEEITHLSEEVNVPGPLRRRPLYDELVARRKALDEGKTPVSTYFGETPVIEVYFQGKADPLPSEEVVICNLEGWDKPGWMPPASEPFAGRNTKVAVDPALGRLCTLQGITDTLDRVSYAYGFSGDLGGGPYNRQAPAIEDWRSRPDIWQVGVSQQKPAVATEVFTTLGDAIQAWNTWSAANPGKPGVIVVMDSATYEEDLTGARRIELPEGSRLLLIAADWPVAVESLTGIKRRIRGQFVPEGLRPHLRGDVSVVGTAPGGSPNPGQLLINGLLIEGDLNVLVGNLGWLTLSHCTLLPSAGGLVINTSVVDTSKQNSRLRLTLERCISGPLELPDTVPELRVSESIVELVDPLKGPFEAIVALGSKVRLEASTILGTTQVKTLDASNTIFEGLVTVTRRQTGCVRFSFVPAGSRTPRRYRCQPDLEIATRIEQLEKSPDFQKLTEAQKKAQRDEIQADVVSWLLPSFTSTRYGNPAYGQLGRYCPRQIAEGAEDGSEMGAFGFLKQPQRETNLRVALEEYLRFGLEAGLFYVT
jgi:hypothetical protein